VGREYEPTVGQWYDDLENDETFQVLRVDEDREIVEIQHLDGDIEELDVDDWAELDLELTEEPEGWSGSKAEKDAEDEDEDEDKDAKNGERRAAPVRDAYLVAKAHFDLGEYERCAHFLGVDRDRLAARGAADRRRRCRTSLSPRKAASGRRASRTRCATRARSSGRTRPRPRARAAGVRRGGRALNAPMERRGLLSWPPGRWTARHPVEP